jgi:L-threonylcarbamoyladenylate synthase
VTTTRVLQVDRDQPDPKAIAAAAAILRSGGLVAFATETVYGLGADATNPRAVARVFEAKGRPATNPLIVHVATKAAALACVADWPARAELLAEAFWPGPLTLVLPRSRLIPDLVTAGQETVGVRVPVPGVARWLILEAGCPVAAPSANRSNGISPTLAEHVQKDLDGRVDLILDSGPTTVGIESTVLDLTTAIPRVLRPGRVTPEAITRVLGEPVEAPGDSGTDANPARSPGLMKVHYAPKTPAYRLDRDHLDPWPVGGLSYTMCFGDDAGLCFGPMGSGVLGGYVTDPEQAERSLYADLHELDEGGLDYILIILPPDEPKWKAIRDRIWRATRPWPPGSED